MKNNKPNHYQVFLHLHKLHPYPIILFFLPLEKGMTEIVNSLKGVGIIKGAQATLLSSFIKIRNKAFHAEWDKIDTADVKSLIAFTEEFISVNFWSSFLGLPQ